jgi:very-short-patch-repair endonuclease
MEAAALRSLVEARWPASAVATTDVLATAGITDRVLTSAVRARCVHRVRRGAYVLMAVWNAAAPWEKDLYRIDGHAATRATPATYSHTTAARLLGCAVWDVGERIHLTVPYASSARSHGADVAAHRQPVGDEDLVHVLRSGRMLRLTSVDRTVADCARILDLERAAVVGDHALRRGASVDGIAAAAERSGLVRGARRVERLLGALDPRAESPGETRTRIALAAAGLPAPELQFEVMTEEGLYRADFAWPELKVILEFDGDSKYFAYRPTAEVLLAERRRENALAAAGWVVVRVRWADLSTPGVIAAKVLAAFARAAKLAS